MSEQQRRAIAGCIFVIYVVAMFLMIWVGSQ